MQGRGLKRSVYKVFTLTYQVAPRAGAWIETVYVPPFTDIDPVAPRAGAWIETRQKQTHASG